MEVKTSTTVLPLTRAPKKGSAQSVKRISNWAVLINSQQSEVDYDQYASVADVLIKATRHVFDNPANFNNIFKADVKKNLPYKPKIAKAPPPEVHSAIVPEIGSKQNRIHIHVSIAVTHYGKVHMDYQEVQKQLREFITDEGMPNPFISIKHYQSMAGLAAYMGKAVNDEKQLHTDLQKLNEQDWSNKKGVEFNDISELNNKMALQLLL